MCIIGGGRVNKEGGERAASFCEPQKTLISSQSSPQDYLTAHPLRCKLSEDTPDRKINAICHAWFAYIASRHIFSLCFCRKWLKRNRLRKITPLSDHINPAKIVVSSDIRRSWARKNAVGGSKRRKRWLKEVTEKTENWRKRIKPEIYKRTE